MLRLVETRTNTLKNHLAKIERYLAGGAITRREFHQGVRSAHRAVREATSRPKESWIWRGHIVSAYSKAEARSELKRKLGLKRLPAGAVVMPYDDSEIPF